MNLARGLLGSQKTKALQYHLSTLTDKEEYTFLSPHPEERYWACKQEDGLTENKLASTLSYTVQPSELWN